MKLPQVGMIIPALALAANAFAVVPPSFTVTGYGITKEVSFSQDSSSDPVLATDPYRLTAFISSDATVPDYSVTTPDFGVHSFGSGGYSSSRYANLTDFNTAFPNGEYMMSDTFHNPTLPNLTGDLYPTVGKILAGTWQAGALRVNASQDYTLNFTGLASPGINDSIGLVFENSISHATSVYFPGGGATSFLITGGTLVDGQTYNVSLRLNYNLIDTASISGANGSASYTTVTGFQISAIPEPSTYAAILGACALAGVIIQRRRRALAA